jgi:hypothetical protein
MVPEVILNAVVVEHGVVHVKQEHNFTWGCHPLAYFTIRSFFTDVTPLTLRAISPALSRAF